MRTMLRTGGLFFFLAMFMGMTLSAHAQMLDWRMFLNTQLGAYQQLRAHAQEPAPVPAAAQAPAAVAQPQAAPMAPVAAPVLPAPPQVMDNQSMQVEKSTYVPIIDGDEHEDSRPQRTVDTRWIKDTLRDINNFLREVKALVKKAKATPGIAERVNNLLAQANTYKQHIAAEQKSGDIDALEDALRGFHEDRDEKDRNLWEQMNAVRMGLEMPRQVKDLARAIKNITKLLAQKQTIKALEELGLDLNALKASTDAWHNTLTAVQASMSQEDYEAAQEAMEEFHQEGRWPGELEGVLHNLRDAAGRLRGIKNAELKEAVLDVLQDVLEAVREGDYRDARELMEAIRPELEKLWQQFMGFGMERDIDPKMQAKLDRLRAKLEATLERFDAREPKAE